MHVPGLRTRKAAADLAEQLLRRRRFVLPKTVWGRPEIKEGSTPRATEEEKDDAVGTSRKGANIGRPASALPSGPALGSGPRTWLDSAIYARSVAHELGKRVAQAGGRWPGQARP